VRRLVGYQRFRSHAAHAQLARLSEAMRRSVHCFQPRRTLTDTTGDGARVRKRFDRARTPYQRLVASGVLSPTQQEGLPHLDRRRTLVALRARIDAGFTALWRRATPLSRPVLAPTRFPVPIVLRQPPPRR
jgi:hypothetical protein